MKIFLSIIITLIVISVIIVLLIKKSVKSESTQINWVALAQGSLTMNITLNLSLPFAVTLDNFNILLGAGGNPYFKAVVGTLKLNPGLNIVPITFVPTGTLDALTLASLATQKKYVNISGNVLGMSFARTEYL